MAFQTNGSERHDAMPDASKARRAARPDEASKLAYGVGVCGAIACSVAMVALPLGLVAAGVTSGAKAASGSDSMAGMSGGTSAQQPAWLAALLTYGPELLIGSVFLIVLALAMRRSGWAAVAVVGGTVLYVGMYLQQSIAVMDASIIAGIAILLASALGFRISAAKGRLRA